MNSAPNVQPSPRFPIDTVLQLVAALSGVQVTLETRKQPLKGLAPSVEHAWIEVDVGAFEQLGTDEMRVQANAAGTGNVFLLRGERRLSTTLKAKSLDATLQAWSLLERVRFRLRTDFAANIFEPAGLSIASNGAAMRIRAFHEVLDLQGEASRQIKVAVMEIKWNWCSYANLSATDQTGGGIITRVNGGQPPTYVGIIPGNVTN
jgi:hypothetical protein